MGLFNVFKKQQPKQEKFTSVIIKTDNVSKTLSEISQKYQIPLSNLDFDVLGIDTYIKLSKDEDFVSIDNQTIELIKYNNLLTNSDLEIKQSYEIKVRKFRFLNDFELIGKMKINKYKTKVTYIVSSESILNYSETLEFQVLEELKKKKIKSGLLVDFILLEENFLDSIKNLVAKIRILGMIEDEYEIELCKGIEPVLSVSLQIIEHYKKKETTNKLVKELIYPIKKGDLIVEIIKPKNGKNGRNCKGELIKVKKIKKEEIPTYNITDDVTKRDYEDKVLYISNKNGYVYIKDGAIFVKDELEVNQISLKTGNIKGASENDIKLEVKEKGILKEAIKDGMIVETTQLIVKGNIGKGVKIKAKQLEIDGQTHRDSKILAINSEINCHKGYLKGKNVIISRLEGGRVEADKILIDQAISGKVIGKEIKIKLMGSHITLIGSELIEIDVLKGNENRFIIDEGMVENKEEFIKKEEDKYKQLEIKLRHLKEKIKQNKKMIIENQPTIDKIKQKIKYNRENNISVNPIFIQKIKKFNDFIKKTKELEQKSKDIILKLKHIKNELNKLQKGVFLAKVISHSGFPEYNRIEFHLIEPPIKLNYDTKKDDEYTNSFVLKDLGDEYKIVGEKE